MKPTWVDHKYAGGCTLTLASGVEGQVNWSTTRGKGYEAFVEGYKRKEFGADREAAKRWVERALRKKLTDALAALNELAPPAEGAGT